MISKSVSLNTLLKTLEHENHIDKSHADKIQTAIRQQSYQTVDDPIYIRILFGIGAWMSTIFILIFLGISGLLGTDSINIISGLIFLAVAIGIQRSANRPFLSQLSLALSFTGNILVLFGILEFFRFNNPLPAVIVQAVICGIMYPLFNNSVYRFLSPLGLVFLVWMWIFAEKLMILTHPIIAIQLVVAGYLLLFRKTTPKMAPLTYATTLMLPGSILFITLSQIQDFRIPFHQPLWPSSIIIALGVIYMLIHLAGGKEKLKEPWLILALFSTFLLGLTTTPGILVAIALMIIGYAHDNKIISLLSILFLVCFLVFFYYALNIDLAHKSWIVAGSGIILLIVRRFVMRLQSGEAV